MIQNQFVQSLHDPLRKADFRIPSSQDFELTMSLCDYCQAIPAHFFQFKNGPGTSIKSLLDHTVPHRPILFLRISADSGCPLCKILVSGIKDHADDLPLHTLLTRRTNLRLAMIDSHQAFSVCVDLDDYNHVFYYHIPPSFSE